MLRALGVGVLIVAGISVWAQRPSSTPLPQVSNSAPITTITPAVGSSDTLSCSGTPGITTAPVAFATVQTLPAFTQIPGATFNLGIHMLLTTSAVPPSLTLTLKDGSTVVYTTALTAISANTAGWDEFTLFSLSASPIGTSGTVTTGLVGSLGGISTSNVFNRTAPVTLNTTTTGTISLSVQCSLATAGNTFTLVQWVPQLIF
jgi:hypothetical protein